MNRLFIAIIVVICSFYMTEARAQDRFRSGSENRSESFPVQKGGLIDINSRFGDLLISTWDKAEVVITVDGLDADDADDLEIQQVENRIRVDFNPRNSRWSKRVRFKVDIPAEFDVDLQTGAGEIEITGQIIGEVHGRTSGGDITLDDVDGEVDISTSGGDIRVGVIKGRGFVKTSGGDIRVEQSIADLDIHTSGGDIRLGDIGRRLDARTSGGDIEVGNVGGEARVNTSGGDIEVGEVAGDATLSTAGGDIELRSAEGEVRATTAGGTIDLRDITGSVEARTAGGDVSAELIPSGTGRSSLSTAGGDVTLFINKDAKATIEARIQIEKRGRGRWSRDRDYDRLDYKIESIFTAERYDEDLERGEIRATYILNGGGERISLETANGNIEIRELLGR